MRVRVTCAGIVIGTADFTPAAGVAHALLDPGSGYAFAAEAAQALGRELCSTDQFWSAARGDFADEAAARWSGDRLGLEDVVGRDLGVNNLVVIEYPSFGGVPTIRVVADFRPDMARVEAFLRTIGPGGGGGRTRPAA